MQSSFAKPAISHSVSRDEQKALASFRLSFAFDTVGKADVFDAVLAESQDMQTEMTPVELKPADKVIEDLIVSALTERTEMMISELGDFVKSFEPKVKRPRVRHCVGKLIAAGKVFEIPRFRTFRLFHQQ